MERKGKNPNLENSITGIQATLARIALENPEHRFKRLYNLVWNPQWLKIALESVWKSQESKVLGAEEIVGDEINRLHEKFLKEISEELREGNYQPDPVRKTIKVKANGNLRPFGIPTMKDKVVQETIRLILEPILKSHFLDGSKGFKSSRRAMDCIHLISLYASNQTKYWWGIQGEIDSSGDRIPHQGLMEVLSKYIADRKILGAIEKFLKAGFIEKGKVSRPNTGVIQAGTLSPLLANIYLHEVDKYWWNKYGSMTEDQKSHRRQQGMANVQYVRYEDRVIILTNGNKSQAQELQEEFSQVLSNLKLAPLPEKPIVSHINDGIEFLGFRIERVYSDSKNQAIVLVTPSATAIASYKDTIEKLTCFEQVNVDVASKIKALNRAMVEWAEDYKHVNSGETFKKLDFWTSKRLFLWLKKKHSNVSKNMSVAKFVIQNYRITTRQGCQVWGVGNVTLRRLSDTKITRYKIN
jgi:group II intron reverse transcriptase/maturase